MGQGFGTATRRKVLGAGHKSPLQKRPTASCLRLRSRRPRLLGNLGETTAILPKRKSAAIVQGVDEMNSLNGSPGIKILAIDRGDLI